MELRWYISFDGIRTLQYKKAFNYWSDIDSAFEVDRVEYIKRLEKELYELKIDYQALIDARK